MMIFIAMKHYKNPKPNVIVWVEARNEPEARWHCRMLGYEFWVGVLPGEDRLPEGLDYKTPMHLW